jgi:hypothetical protein
VPLIKSLICPKGYDTGRRFAVISLICYLVLAVSAPVLSTVSVLLILFFIIGSPVIALGSMRRVHDAGFATALAAIPLVTYWINLFGLTYLESNSKWSLLIL